MTIRDYIYLAIILLILGLSTFSECRHQKTIKTLANIEASQKELLEKADKLELTQKIIADSIGKVETNIFSNIKKIKIYK